MIPVRGFEGKTVAVFGLARTGLTAARALARRGAEVALWDDRPAAREGAELVEHVVEAPYRRRSIMQMEFPRSLNWTASTRLRIRKRPRPLGD